MSDENNNENSNQIQEIQTLNNINNKNEENEKNEKNLVKNEKKIENEENKNSENENLNNINNQEINQENQIEICPEQMNFIYGSQYDIEIEKKLQNDKLKLISFQNNLNTIDYKFNIFKEEINQLIIQDYKKIYSLFDLKHLNKENDNNNLQNNLKNYTKNLKNFISKLFNIKEQIMDSINIHLKIFDSFLEITKSFNYENNPIERFLEKNLEKIINSWMFPKINLDKINLTNFFNKTNLEENLKNYIKNTLNNSNLSIEFSNFNIKDEEKLKEKKNNDIKFLQENKSKISKLKLNFINQNEIKDYLNDFNLPNLQSLTMNNCNLMNLNFNEKFSNLNKINFNKCSDFNVNCLNNINNLQILSLNKIGLINSGFENVINFFIKNDNLKSNLEILNFSDNNINNIRLNEIVYSNNHSFYNLKEMNFNKNKISDFLINKDFFPNLKFINLCKNNFSSFRLRKKDYKNILILLNGNNYLIEDNLREKYYNEIKEKISEFKYNIKFFSLSWLFNLNNNNLLNNFYINSPLRIGLTKLDLSYCSIDNKIFFNFFDSNKGMLNLKILNLNGNLLTDDFFSTYISNQFQTKLEKLTNLHINDNNFELENINKFYEFILINKNLAKLNITKNPFSKKYSVVLPKGLPKGINLKNYDLNSKNLIDFYHLLLIIMQKYSINDENNKKENEKNFIMKFDIGSSYNILSNNVEFITKKKVIIYKT